MRISEGGAKTPVLTVLACPSALTVLTGGEGHVVRERVMVISTVEQHTNLWIIGIRGCIIGPHGRFPLVHHPQPGPTGIPASAPKVDAAVMQRLKEGSCFKR